jgi:hypothetical protein
MKEKILEAFKALGFMMKEFDETAYGFSYEGRSYLFFPNEKDEDFLNIALPCVVEERETDDETFHQIMDKLNSTLKYVKAYKAFEGITLFYERELIGDEDLKMVLRKMIHHLDAGLYLLHRDIITDDDDDSDSGDNDDTDGCEDAEVTEVKDNDEVA